jgi:DNA-binding IclR family transcriptional regulator
VQSVEVGLALFRHLALKGGPLALSELAAAAGMHRSKAHRYLASLVRSGFVRQAEDGRYDLGPFILDLAIASFARQSPLQRAAPVAAQLARECDETCFIAVWGTRGPTVIRLCPPRRQVAISIAEGTVFSIHTSATGRLFAAYLPAAQVAEVQGRGADEPAASGHELYTPGEQQALLAEIRSRGLSVVRGDNVAGINALAAPVFDAQGRIALSLTVVGAERTLDVAYDGPAARRLSAAAQEVSAQLGFAGQAGI